MIQRNGTADQGHRTPKRDAVGDTTAVATRPVVVDLAVVEGEDALFAEPGGPSALKIPPPEANRPLPAAVLPFTSDLLRAIVPWLTMPAPLVWVAVLLSTSLLLRQRCPRWRYHQRR